MTEDEVGADDDDDDDDDDDGTDFDILGLFIRVIVTPAPLRVTPAP